MENEIDLSEVARYFKRRCSWPQINREDNYFTKLNKLRKYYEIEMPFITAHHETGHISLYNAYPYDWMSIHTPIEQDAWNVMRCFGRMALYPQFPVGKYIIDFAAPHLKIGVELDGKEYHDSVKDLARDTELKKQGWKIYRITGSEMSKVLGGWDTDYETEQDCIQGLTDYFFNSGEGVLHAIAHLYFEKWFWFPKINDYMPQWDKDELTFKIERMAKETLYHHTNFHRI